MEQLDSPDFGLVSSVVFIWLLFVFVSPSVLLHQFHTSSSLFFNPHLIFSQWISFHSKTLQGCIREKLRHWRVHEQHEHVRVRVCLRVSLLCGAVSCRVLRVVVGVVWCGVVWCVGVWCVVWCGVVWCGVVDMSLSWWSLSLCRGPCHCFVIGWHTGAWCKYTRGCVESTHGGVLDGHTEGHHNTHHETQHPRHNTTRQHNNPTAQQHTTPQYGHAAPQKDTHTHNTTQHLRTHTLHT